MVSLQPKFWSGENMPPNPQLTYDLSQCQKTLEAGTGFHDVPSLSESM
jgi:hypothetical protein